MDNVCHTLLGAALAEAGLARRTSLGYATLLVGANLPDIDVAAVPFGASLAVRRGWTHGFLALAALPVLLTGAMVWWARRRARRGRPLAAPFLASQVLLLALIAILTHPVLDFLNDYGMRWLMPFSGRWFYGDAVFIVDPWLWLALGVGVLLSRRLAHDGRPSVRPARIALAFTAVYVTAMLGTTAWLRASVARQLAARGVATSRLMVAPVALDPFRRRVVADAGSAYRLGTVSLLHDDLVLDSTAVPKGTVDAAALAGVMQSPRGRAFLSWARFPFFRVERRGASTLVHIGDARYTTVPNEGFGGLTVQLPAAPRAAE